jgi:hypothetical protein
LVNAPVLGIGVCKFKSYHLVYLLTYNTKIVLKKYFLGV